MSELHAKQGPMHLRACNALQQQIPGDGPRSSAAVNPPLPPGAFGAKLPGVLSPTLALHSRPETQRSATCACKNPPVRSNSTTAPLLDGPSAGDEEAPWETRQATLCALRPASGWSRLLVAGKSSLIALSWHMRHWASDAHQQPTARQPDAQASGCN